MLRVKFTKFDLSADSSAADTNNNDQHDNTNKGGGGNEADDKCTIEFAGKVSSVIISGIRNAGSSVEQSNVADGVQALATNANILGDAKNLNEESRITDSYEPLPFTDYSLFEEDYGKLPYRAPLLDLRSLATPVFDCFKASRSSKSTRTTATRTTTFSCQVYPSRLASLWSVERGSTYFIRICTSSASLMANIAGKWSLASTK